MGGVRLAVRESFRNTRHSLGCSTRDMCERGHRCNRLLWSRSGTAACGLVGTAKRGGRFLHLSFFAFSTPACAQSLRFLPRPACVVHAAQGCHLRPLQCASFADAAHPMSCLTRKPAPYRMEGQHGRKCAEKNAGVHRATSEWTRHRDR